MRQSDECGDYYYRDLRKLAMNLIPFPRLHYLLPSYGPLVAEGHAAYQGSTVNELVGSCVPPLPVVVSFQSTSTNAAAVSLPPSHLVFSLFDRHNLLVACDPRYGRYLTAATIFRGQLSAQEVEIAIEQLQSKNSSSFVEYVPCSIDPSPLFYTILHVFVDGFVCFLWGRSWIPDNVSVTMCSVPPVGQKHAGVCLANSVCLPYFLPCSTLSLWQCIQTYSPALDWRGTDVDPRNVETHTEPVCAHVEAAGVPAWVLPGGNGRNGVHGGAEQRRGLDRRVPAIPGGCVRPFLFILNFFVAYCPAI